MTHAQQRLIAICDDLMRAIHQARDHTRPFSAGTALDLIDRVLDTRNQIKNAQPETTNTKTK